MIRGISLFSGAGGLDIGAEQAGLDIVACIESDPDSCDTLRANSEFADAQVFNDDLTQFDYGRVLDLLPEKSSSDKRVVLGGPPCQPFSKNGYWVKNENRDVDRDPRNLVGEFLRAVDECEADAFLLENVESILHPTNRHMSKFIEDWCRHRRFGIKVFLVNSADFGVPQKRKRVFFMGIKDFKWANEEPEATHAGSGSDLDLPEHLGVGSFIHKYRFKKYSEEYEDPSGGTYYHELTNVPAGGNYMALAKIKGYNGRVFRPGSRFWNFLCKLHPEKTSITIAAQPGPWVGPFHWDNRRLRAPEAAAIQTFPGHYRFEGNRRSVRRQIGNAVPPLMARHMAKLLLSRAA